MAEYIPPVKKGKVKKVYDGDTITVVSKIVCAECGKESEDYKFPVRIRGIDTPEIKSPDEETKNRAKEAKQFVSDLCLEKIVYLGDVKKEKYGRLLAHVFLDEEHTQSIGKMLLENGMAVEYDGGKKKV